MRPFRLNERHDLRKTNKCMNTESNRGRLLNSDLGPLPAHTCAVMRVNGPTHMEKIVGVTLFSPPIFVFEREFLSVALAACLFSAGLKAGATAVQLELLQTGTNTNLRSGVLSC